MTDSENNGLLAPEERFLKIDTIIFEIQESDETLAKLITKFHEFADNLEISPVIENDSEAYYKYRFEDPEESNVDICVYTPIPGEQITTHDMNSKNTRAIRTHSYRNILEKINPIEKDEDKKRYLEMLQLVIAVGLKRKLGETNR